MSATLTGSGWLVDEIAAGYDSQPAVTRPANTTAYTAGDVVGGAFQFSGIPAGLQCLIDAVALRIDVAAIPAGMTSFVLHLYSQTPPSALADNAAWDLSAGDRASYLGEIQMGSPADKGSSLYCSAVGVNLPVLTGATGLWAYLVTNGAFTPAGGSEVYNPRAHAVRL